MESFKEFVLNIEMRKYFEKRTAEHIKRVQDNAQLIEKNFPNLKGLVDQTATHDQSKYEDPEIDPYIIITWNYKTGNEASNDEKEELRKASEHHVQNNRHHPEFHDTDDSSTINPDDRDKPLRLVDATKMNDIDIAEMCADWQAMSQELNEGNYEKWAKSNINIRWKYTENQIDLIYEILKLF